MRIVILIVLSILLTAWTHGVVGVNYLTTGSDTLTTDSNDPLVAQ